MKHLSEDVHAGRRGPCTSDPARWVVVDAGRGDCGQSNVFARMKISGSRHGRSAPPTTTRSRRCSPAPGATDATDNLPPAILVGARRYRRLGVVRSAGLRCSRHGTSTWGDAAGSGTPEPVPRSVTLTDRAVTALGRWLRRTAHNRQPMGQRTTPTRWCRRCACATPRVRAPPARPPPCLRCAGWLDAAVPEVGLMPAGGSQRMVEPQHKDPQEYRRAHADRASPTTRCAGLFG